MMKKNLHPARVLVGLFLVLTSLLPASPGNAADSIEGDTGPGAIAPKSPLSASDAASFNVAESLFRDVAGEFRCPTCQGLGVLESDAPFSVQIKDSVRKLLAEGKSKEEIIAFFVERYGPWILRAPPKAGVNSLIWILPLGFLVVGPIGVWLLFWKKPRKVPTYGARTVESILEEMNRELAKMRVEAK
jgi:cytochrome c-type biogenesis protein CcmH